MKWYNKEFLSVVGVTILAMTITFLTLLTDQLIASHMIGEDAFAGIGLTQPITLIVETFAAIFYVGATMRIFAAKATGSDEAVCKVFSTALHLALLGGPVFGLIVFGHRWLIAEFFGAENAITCYCAEYLKYFALGIALLPVTGFLLEILLCEEDYALSVAALIEQLVGNAVASYLLCPSMDVEGIALGSVIADIGAIAICSLHFLRKGNRMKAGVIFSPLEAWRMAIGSIGDMAYPFFQALVAMAVMKFAIGRFGGDSAPIATVMVDILSLSMIFEAFGQAVEPVLGKAYAERDYPVMNGVVRTATLTMLSVALALGAFLVCTPETVLSLLDVDPAEVGAEAAAVVKTMGFSLVALGFVTLYNTCYQFVGHPVVSALLTLLGTLVGPVAAVALCPAEYGLSGFAAALAAGPYLGIFVFLFGLLICRRGRSFPLLLSKEASEREDVARFLRRKKSPFRITRARIALMGIAIFFTVVMTLYCLGVRQEDRDVEWAFDNIEGRFRDFDRLGLKSDEIRFQVTNSCIIADCGNIYMLNEDGETFDTPGEAFDGDNVFERGFDRSAVDSGRTFECILYGMHSKYRIFTACGRRVVLWIPDFDIYWDTENHVSIAALLLLIIIAVIVFFAAAQLDEKNNENRK